MTRALKKLLSLIVPAPLLRRILSFYHFSFAWAGAWFYGHPSRALIVVGVTGTTGKSSTSEMLNAIFEEAGYKTALLNSIRTKIGGASEPNLTRMTMAGRLFIQKSLNKAVRAGCSVAIIEMTSQGAHQHRHRFIDMDALIFTNLAPEHIESHGSYERYADAKFEIGRALASSRKRPRIIVANADDKESARYLKLPVERAVPFSLSACAPWSADETGGHFYFDGLDVHVNLPGQFSLKNAVAAATLAHALHIQTHIIKNGLEKIRLIPGRAEKIEEGQEFSVVVDYAHTPGSLQAFLDAYSKLRKICVLGSAGGGRDVWKRPVIGKIAENSCEHVILTNDDSYDEDPGKIVAEIAAGMKKKPEIILDRREAIKAALCKAAPGDAVLIIGMGIDPMANQLNSKVLWNDPEVTREELRKLAQMKQV